jgi:NCS2 family nucleobase:cation symporter-2
VKKPRNIVYGVDDIPPRGVLLLSGVQHVGLVAIFLLVPVIACREAGMPAEKIIDVLSLSMLVMAVGPILHALRRGPVGSGYLCPPIFAASYLPASLLALQAGGLPLMFGMTIFAGAIEIAVSRVLRPLRPFLPPEIAGFVVAMIGVTVGLLGFRHVFGIGLAEQPGAASYIVAAATLAIMVGLNVWTTGPPKIFCALIGMVSGYLLAMAAGVLPAADLSRLDAAPLMHFPALDHLGWSFDAELIVPFVVAAVAASLRAIGDLTICQKTNDADWVRPEFGSISGGTLANGIGTLLAGMLGTIGLNTSTSNVGLASATGITSRTVAFAVGGIYLTLAFLPKAATVFAIMPAPVVGATLLFAAALVFVNGLIIITSRMLDSRRVFVIGLSFMLALAADVFQPFFSQLPAGVRVFTSSALVVGTLAALLLNLVFRIGVRRTQTLAVDPAAVDAQQIDDFMQTHGAAWGARRDVIERARFNLMQSIELLADSGVTQGLLTVAASFDEFSLDVRVSYDGAPLVLSERRPSNEEIIASTEGQYRLAGYMLRNLADRVQVSNRGGRTTVAFHFDH